MKKKEKMLENILVGYCCCILCVVFLLPKFPPNLCNKKSENTIATTDKFNILFIIMLNFKILLFVNSKTASSKEKLIHPYHSFSCSVLKRGVLFK